MNEKHGRCSRHKPSPKPTSESNQSNVQQEFTSSDTTDPSPESRALPPFRYLVVLGFIGLCFGGAITGSYVLSNGFKWTEWSEKEPAALPADVEEPKALETIDVDNPDWSEVLELQDPGKIVMTLDEIVENSNSERARSLGLYYQFLFYQNQDQPREALSAADQFIQSYPDHALRPEVLYGAGILCEQVSETVCSTDYHQQLREEHPESKWIENISS